ncbi:winged helix-turn-helix domain-containing protein [Brevundimonas aveniformis]|uniref:winged helix-turn-helix domain-containing protein n=1 Tax=Brevundimonas aveniformis TaxID=370977 RepID=UPI000425CBDD|nr:crosslink repair DNA glycosylase YcaQ family protein [Brevundimonas aveniformis]
MTATETLSDLQARRVALLAQGFGDRRPAKPGKAHLRRVFDRVGLIQIDSVNVLSRSHYLPPFARLGAYDHADMDALAWGKRKALFEYWGHEASLIPMAYQPLLRWRMARAEAGVGTYSGLARFGREKRTYIEQVLDEVRRRGPLSAGELEQAGKGAGGWWGWSDGKRAVEWLFWAGLVTTATRRGFERLYDLPERVLPQSVLDTPTPTVEDAQRGLIEIAARAMGVATETDLRDYFRTDPGETRARIAELTEEGVLVPVQVRGWGKAAWLYRDAPRPRKVEATALLSPFDNLIWRRERAERMFGFHYRIEIYVPAHKRVHGYYVLPFLQGERLTARCDLKADRQARVLRVQAVHREDHAQPLDIAPALAERLQDMAAWMDLGDIEVHGHGEAATALREAVS